MAESTSPSPKTALVLVDVQNDFLPGGALAVTDGDRILGPTRKLIDDYEWDLITYSVEVPLFLKDIHPLRPGHPAGHVSFASSHPGHDLFSTKQVPIPGAKDGKTIGQTLWPDHCVQGSSGAEIEKSVMELLGKVKGTRVVQVNKGTDSLIDSYSAFADNGRLKFTEMRETLNNDDIKRVVVVGLATDYCVRATVIDALEFGFETTIIREGVRGVHVGREDADKAEEESLEELAGKGARIVGIDDFQTQAGSRWKGI